MVRKTFFYFEFPDILDTAGKKIQRKRIQTIARRYAFHANAIKRVFMKLMNIHHEHSFTKLLGDSESSIKTWNYNKNRKNM